MPLLWIGGQQGARSGAERVHQEEVAKPREKKTPVAAKEAIKKESLSDDSNSSEEEVNKAPFVAKPVTKAFDEESVVEPRLTVECDIPAEEASEVSSTSLFKSERLKKEKVAEQLKELKELRERKKKKNSEQKIDEAIESVVSQGNWKVIVRNREQVGQPGGGPGVAVGGGRGGGGRKD